jgi:hypothetical protein
MSPEEQRIKIAEACGWKNCRYDTGTVNMPPKGEPDDDFNRDVEEHKTHKPYCGFPVDPHREVLPDYLNDLNSAHEMEKVLSSEGDKYKYSAILFEMTGGSTGPDGEDEGSQMKFHLCHATAAQRCEAFLKTLGLWKDE